MEKNAIVKTQGMKAVSYSRVSSREQEETGYSLDSQEKLLAEYADKKGYTIARGFRVSESASGAKMRQVFSEMMKVLKDKDIHILICEKTDRLTRSRKDAVIVDEWVKQDPENQVHFVKENFVLTRESRANERFIWGIKVEVAQYYTNNLSEEVKKGQKEKIAQGWLPTKPPAGYRTVGEKGHKIHVIDEPTAPFIREMFEMYSTGNYSLRLLVQKMHDKGFRNRSGGKIGRSRMHALLSNPFYCGDLEWKGQVTKGSHPEIITRDLFERVQFLLGRKVKSPQYRKHFPVFKAKVHCAECGGTITWELQKGNWYGHCNHYKNCKQEKWIRQDRLEENLLPHLEAVAPKSTKVLQWLERALKESHTDEIESNTKKRQEIDSAIRRANNRIEKAYIDKLDGCMEAGLCERVIADSKKELVTLHEALNGLNQAHTAYYEAGYAIHELAAQATAIYQSPRATVEEKRLLLSQAFSEIDLKNGEIKAHYSYAFEFLAEWMPKLNKSFEQTENAQKAVALQGVSVVPLTFDLDGASGASKQFRTSKKRSVKARPGQTMPTSRLLLRG